MVPVAVLGYGPPLVVPNLQREAGIAQFCKYSMCCSLQQAINLAKESTATVLWRMQLLWLGLALPRQPAHKLQAASLVLQCILPALASHLLAWQRGSRRHI